MSKVRHEKNRQVGLIMRTYIFPSLLAAFAIGGAALWSPAADMRTEADPIDFARLHEQGSSAMHLLQVSQERRMAVLQAGEFEF
jgi:hypothetical protein